MKKDDKLFIKDNFSKMDNKNWQEEKRYWHDRLKAIQLPEDLQMANLYESQKQLCKLLDGATMYYYYYKTKYENVKNKVNTVKKTSLKGSNPEQRKANARKKLTNYNVDEVHTINLIELRQRWKDRYDFYVNIMEILEKKQNAISNSIGMAKIDAQIQTGYGAQ